MAFSARDTKAYRDDERSGNVLLQRKQREELVKRYLPAPPGDAISSRNHVTSRQGFVRFVREKFYLLLYTVIHAIFSAYIRVRIAYHAVALQIYSILRYHHHTPEYIRRDVGHLKKLPKHVSVILTLEDGGKRGDAIEKLTNEVADVAAWCASAGIVCLSVYEKTGALKLHRSRSHAAVTHKLKDWFGTFQAPQVHLHTPNMDTIHPHNYSGAVEGSSGRIIHGKVTDLAIKLISVEDGRESMVDLTKVLTQMVQRSKLASPGHKIPSADDITTDIIDQELSEAVIAEPDLLISFAPYVDLQGYPPWQIRLTEIFCMPDNQEVGYQVFLEALKEYAAATFKLGK